MRPQRITPAALLAIGLATAFVAAACAKKEGHAASPGTARAPAPTPPASTPTVPARPAPAATTPEPIIPPPAPTEIAVAEETLLLLPADADIPTQEEMDQRALLSIDESNADDEFEKLKQELGGG